MESFGEGWWEWQEGKSGGEVGPRQQPSRKLNSYSEVASVELGWDAEEGKNFKTLEVVAVV